MILKLFFKFLDRNRSISMHNSLNHLLVFFIYPQCFLLFIWHMQCFHLALILFQEHAAEFWLLHHAELRPSSSIRHNSASIYSQGNLLLLLFQLLLILSLQNLYMLLHHLLVISISNHGFQSALLPLRNLIKLIHHFLVLPLDFNDFLAIVELMIFQLITYNPHL